MGQKDLTQKGLEAYPDVFADIINALLHGGKSSELSNKNYCKTMSKTI